LFIDQLLDTLGGKKYFSFWMVLVVIIRFSWHLKIKIKPHLLVHGEPMPTEYFLLGYVMHLQHSKEQ
ncbi:hypothetical protein D1615_30120, partial [Klebsiella pneumoniae]|uniref:hypothetical protein n=1 Tax=Klebsiella pneumoniae TaxID=573 RepID=UPI000FF20674